MTDRSLWDYCDKPMSVCAVAKNDCDKCEEKEEAEERKKRGEPARPIAKK